MIDLGRLFDSYNRQARLYPALIIIFPLVLLMLAWFPALQTPLGIGASLACSFGILLWLSQIARDGGKREEPMLYSRWGGKPSVALLRHRDNRIDRNSKARYRAFLETRVPGLRLPSEKVEAANPAAADEAYESVTAWLLTQTRDTKRFALIFQENISYGFRRNLLGLKRAGVTLSLIAGTASTFVLGYRYLVDGQIPQIEPLLATLIAWCLFICWLAIVRPTWVRIPADAYGRQLLAACDSLQTVEHPEKKPA
jgi:hypothetical protein